jgi:hypothetical protein
MWHTLAVAAGRGQRWVVAAAPLRMERVNSCGALGCDRGSIICLKPSGMLYFCILNLNPLRKPEYDFVERLRR